MPPPSRPSTSSGFTEKGKGTARDSDSDDGSERMDVDVDGRGAKRKRTKDDSSIGTGTGTGKVKQRVQASNGSEPSYRRATTVGPTSIGQGGGGKRQSTLMLPPPAQSQRAISGASSSNSTSNLALSNSLSNPKANSTNTTVNGETKKPITAQNGITAGKGVQGTRRGGIREQDWSTRDIRRRSFTVLHAIISSRE